MPFDPLNVRLICSKVFMGHLYFKEEKHRLVQLAANHCQTFEGNQERFGLLQDKNKQLKIEEQNGVPSLENIISHNDDNNNDNKCLYCSKDKITYLMLH